MRFKRLISGLTSAVLALSAFAGTSFSAPEKGFRAEAAEANWSFDFGGNGTADGYTGVSASTGYSASAGYGFAQTGNVSNVSAGGSGALSDAVKFNSTDGGNTFNVDLPNGLYRITVTTGNVSRTTIKMEGMLQMINLTGNNAVETVEIPVTDGQLNVQAVAGRANTEFSISAMQITQLNTTGETRPTIWLCGDSTVANYYNTVDTAQHGWGQFLGDYINTNIFQVRNMAASGQYAKGFVDGGQFDAIETYGKSGDYYIISIGINDTSYSNADEYYNVVTDMVQRAKAKGMTVYLVKQQGRHSDLNRNPLLGGRWFGGQLDTIGSEQNVTVFDLFTEWQNFGLTLGYDGMTDYYGADDDLHQSKLGAQKIAEIMHGLMKIGDTAMDTSVTYQFKNTNSGLVMDIEGGNMAEGTNVQQWGSSGVASQQWTLQAFAGGTDYYYVRSVADPTYVLKAMTGSDGGNIEIVPFTTTDSMMLFKFTKMADGSYYISTRSSRDACFVEIANASRDSGANVQQWGMTYNKCQNWQAETVTTTATEPATQETTTTTTTTTVATEAPTEAPTQAPNNIMQGDADCNGSIDISDAVLIMSYIANKESFTISEQGILNADVYQRGDGISLGDAVLIQKVLAKLDHFEELPETEQPTETTTVTTMQSLYYAVDQTYIEGVSETVNAGYTGSAYVNLDNNNTSNLTWTINVPQAGNYLCTFNIANGTEADRQMKIEVNGNTESFWVQSFLGTGAWTTWAERAIVLPLTAGTNTIKMTSWTENGGPNLDYLRLELTDEPIAEIYIPTEEPTDPVSENPVVYIAGDSTVQSYRASYAPQQGWGYYLADYFNENVTVANHAIAGRSSKSFYDNGRLTTILDSMKEGDYLLVQFAINDSASSNAERYAPVCGDVNNPTEGSYEWYLTKYIEGALEKGGTPILVTTVIGMKAYSGGQFVNSYGNYCQAMKDLAAKYSIPCIDLNSLMVAHYNSVGYDTAKSYHLMGAVEGSTDGTHFCETGANIVAGIVANAIKGLNIPLSSNVK